jgi:RNA polymerase sigma-70 factor (ECF subfamily)
MQKSRISNPVSAFEREALPHLAEAREFAYRMCGDRSHAADLVQEAFLKAFRSFSTFTAGSNCRAWLFQIIKNSYINERRRARFHGNLPVQRSESDRMEVDPFDQIPAPPTQAERIDDSLGDEIARALDNLPEMYKTIVILSDVEEYQYEEIAEFLNRPVGTVRSRLHRARKLLHDELGSYARRTGYLAA